MVRYTLGMKDKVAIIGGGMTGLVLAYRLTQKEVPVMIFEKSDSLGGLMGGFKINGTSLEKAYHHIFRTDTDIIALTKELGLENKLKWHPEKTSLYYDKKMYSFTSPMDLLKFKPLDLVSKIRLGLVKIWLEKDNNWQKYIEVTAVEWMKKYCGDKAYRVVWEPLLRGKFHEYYDKVSMAWMWARIHTRANSDGCLGYFDGGFQILVDELQKRILKQDGVIKTGTEVDFKKIEKDFDKVIYTGPSKGIDYLGAICVVFSAKQNLSKYYWHNINDTRSPFLAFIQHTNLVNSDQYKGEQIYYMGTYLPMDHKYFTQDPEKDFFNYLKKMFPEFDPKLVTKKFLFRLKNAQHIVTTDYKVPPQKLSEKVYQCNFAQIFPEDRGTNFAVREANKLAAVLMK